MNKLKQYLENDPNPRRFNKHLEGRVNIQNRHQKFSEIRSPPNISIDEINKFRNAFNRSQMEQKRNNKLSSAKGSEEGSRNRGNLGTNEMWSRVSSKRGT